MLINKIIKLLKAGSIPSVVLFGDTDIMPEPPYVVVKPETGAIEGTRQFRIIVHHRQGMFDELEKYVFKELTSLLINDENKKICIIDKNGLYQLHCGGWTDMNTDISDKTIFMERLFYQPFRSGDS